MAKKKRPTMSKEEEEIQRALGTLPKFEVQVERTITKTSFARVYVTAGDEETAKKRALELSSHQSETNEQSVGDNIIDDTGSPIAWADNQQGDISKPIVIETRELAKDDYMIHRFDSKTKPPGEDEGKLDPFTLGTPM